MGFTAAGISPTTVTTTQQCPLGFELTVPDGDKGFQTWVYVKAGFVLARGFGTVLAGAAAGLTANEGITPGGTNVTALGGTALDFDAGTVAGGCVIGHCTVAAASSNLASAYIKCM
jgi:hypothetical protein